mmetsp:Transcript_3810/g.7752  ORF Transcript_3810/g.7752 Transcript_3810/m.7752 type:complete len:210 (-) Transcript_3810:139-768(-)
MPTVPISSDLRRICQQRVTRWQFQSLILLYPCHHCFRSTFNIQMGCRDDIQQSFRRQHSSPQQRLCVQIKCRKLTIQRLICATLSLLRNGYTKVRDIIHNTQPFQVILLLRHINTPQDFWTGNMFLFGAHNLYSCKRPMIRIQIDHVIILPSNNPMRTKPNIFNTLNNLSIPHIHLYHGRLAKIVEHGPHMPIIRWRERIHVLFQCKQL